MAPTPSSKNHTTPTPSSKLHQTHVNSRTPQSKHRLNFNSAKPSPNPNSTAMKEGGTPPEHPVEVIGRIRDYPDKKEKSLSALQVNSDCRSLRVRTDIGYRDFTLDGVSLSEEEDLDEFYKKFVESRIDGVKLGDKCTIMMYGPTGAGKSHTMFGSVKQPGIVYRSLKDILGDGNEESDENSEKKVGVGTFVHVTVLEIYNEEIYDLLSTTNGGGGFAFGWSKACASKVKLEVIGKKAKNATFISGTEAIKISKEIQKVEKRRIVKSTLCNERSSRSHCMIILDVPTVGGRLMLVDMAGSENIEQAGQTGLEAKMQTAKINQGNIALKRVVESIANGDSHVPFRDSKLTMLLQDSFEDDKSKILMILCASPDPKELHKTISTLEYGAKAKCIVRGPHTPLKEKGTEDSSSTVILGSRIAVMDQFIYKLQMENKLKEKERNEAQKELMKKEEEMATLRAKLELVQGKGTELTEEQINLKVNERTQMLKNELEKKIQECQKMANEIVEMERRKMEERMFQQQQEFETLRRRLEDMEAELHRSRAESGSMEENTFAKRLQGIYSEDAGMVKSMDLDRSIDMDAGKRDVLVYKPEGNTFQAISGYPNISNLGEVEDPLFPNKSSLSTVFEEDEEGDDEGDTENLPVDEEVQKEVIEEKTIYSGLLDHDMSCLRTDPDHFSDLLKDSDVCMGAAPSRQALIQNIFTLCGNYRELSQHSVSPVPAQKNLEDIDSSVPIVKTIGEDYASAFAAEGLSNDLLPLCNPETIKKSPVNQTRMFKSSCDKENDSKENFNPTCGNLEVHVKWEAASKENPSVATTVKVGKDSSLADLRKQIELHLGADSPFTFLTIGDPSGAPMPKEQEVVTSVSKLPKCNNFSRGHLAYLRPVKGTQRFNHLPFTPLENMLPLTPKSHIKEVGTGLSPKIGEHLSRTPFVTVKRYLNEF
ncbi:kinesin-like protein KIN-10A [Solanum pennellii]|uniref:Kinesin-like protein KIN-10A n=1 Tax=Solanum pennellii TaxID=28526 RepID=A0ABM1HJF7_SOLPN|nr:kinesin-like protein KIN-10A [Solanum pennellii]